MKPSPISLSGMLGFDRGGRRLVVCEPDAISIVAPSSSDVDRIAIEDARGAVGFDDELWIASHDDRLLRVDYAGRALGEPLALPFAARAALVPAPCGAPAVVWSSTPAVAICDDSVVHLPDVDAVIPLTGRRFVTARGNKVTLPSGVVVTLQTNASVLAGAVLVDGRSVALLSSDLEGPQLLLISLGSGQVVSRLAMPSTRVRLATRRALAIAAVAPDTMLAVDLAAGRELGWITFDDEVSELAISPDGRQLALRDPRGAIELCELAALVQRTRRTQVVEATAPATPQEPVRAEQPSAPAAAAVAVEPARVVELPDAPLRALAPRTRPAAVERALANTQLAIELRSVALWTNAAIAEAWDSRRIGYGNEGKHPFELEVGALLGMNGGFATEYVAAARAHLAAHEQRLAADCDWREPHTPIGQLMTELELSPLAIDILIVIAAASLRGETARLYGVLANDASRTIVDEQLVHEVLGARCDRLRTPFGSAARPGEAGPCDRHDLARELDPRAPLIRLGVVQTTGKRARPFAELAVDPVILDRLRGIACDLGPATTVRVASCPLDELDIPREVVAAACHALARPSSQPARIVVRGRTGSGRRTLLAALAERAGRDVAVIDALALARDPRAFAADLGLALRRAQLAGHLPCVVHVGEVMLGEQSAREVAGEAMRVHPGPIAVIASRDETIAFGPGHVAIELPVLGETERLAVWRSALTAAARPVDDVARLAARYRVGPGVIRRAVAAGPDLDAFLRQTRDTRLVQYARRIERLASWSNIVLPPDILDSLRELVARVRHGRQVYETWGMSRTLATSRGLTALFQGPPGTGKTLVAGVIARELGLDLYQVDLSKVMSKWIGETERNLATIFDAAEDGQVVLLFDEADSLFAKRTEIRSSNDRYANLEVNYLLQRLDAFEGIAILTTNHGRSIDSAFSRRMSFRLSFPFPDEETRERLWCAHLPPELPLAGPLALDVLARKYQLSGGYIRNACLRAAFLAAQDESPLHQRHLERAVTLEYAELGKLSTGGAID